MSLGCRHSLACFGPDHRLLFSHLNNAALLVGCYITWAHRAHAGVKKYRTYFLVGFGFQLLGWAVDEVLPLTEAMASLRSLRVGNLVFPLLIIYAAHKIKADFAADGGVYALFAPNRSERVIAGNGAAPQQHGGVAVTAALQQALPQPVPVTVQGTVLPATAMPATAMPVTATFAGSAAAVPVAFAGQSGSMTALPSAVVVPTVIPYQPAAAAPMVLL